ncbi:MFS-type transporter SLC18B1 isoform X2 [Chiloscyllium plagiosum]|uniref:MFS-type transporter SLC18B1 isoform X2 n=1 Tax=Chiloscyllium plagiosum TaxID=36176 RepID=UPI001CB8663E|nr:MFS-type transporter SLC18B1 isoform X2 [Chiloscyllium plagiosum]
MSGQRTEGDQNENSRNESQKWTRSQIFTLVSAASLNFSSMICYSILAPFFPKEDLGVTGSASIYWSSLTALQKAMAGRKGANDTVVGMIFGCFALFNLVFSLVLGKYIIQIGAKFMFLSGMFISGWSTILFGLLDKAPNGPIFITLCFIIRSMDAVGFAGSITASFSILASTFPNNVATIMGLLEIFSGLGLVMGPPVGGFLYQTFGYEVPFIALGCIVLLMVPLNMCILPNYGGIASKESFWKLLAIPKITFVCLIIISISSCIGFLDPTISLFVTEKFNLHSGYIGLVFLGFALSYALSSPLLGYLSDNVPRIRKWLMLIGSWLIAVSFFLLGPAPIFHIKCRLWMFVLMLVISGISLSLSGIPVFPEIISCVYENGFEEGLGTLGLVSGMFGACWCLGSFVGPTLGGYLYEKLGFEWAAFIQGSFPLFFGSLLGLFFIVEIFQKRRSLSGIHTDEEQAPLISN